MINTAIKFDAPVTMHDRAFSFVIEEASQMIRKAVLAGHEYIPSLEKVFPFNSKEKAAPITFHAEESDMDMASRFVNYAVFAGAVAFLMTSSSGLMYGVGAMCMALAARKVAAVAIGYLAYPMALLSLLNPFVKADFRKACENTQINLGKVVKVEEVVLYKGDTAYSGVLITSSHPEHKGKWAINALGNGMSIEDFMEDNARENFADGCSTLLINGPSVGKGGGVPTPYHMRSAFELGLQLLESKNPTHIVMKGFSLGGGMLAEAIKNHEFKKEIKYLFEARCTFGTLSGVAAELVSSIVKPIFYALGLELDVVGAALQLKDQGIDRLIVQGINGDGIIPDKACLRYGLGRNVEKKELIESNRIRHNFPLPRSVEEKRRAEIAKFINS